MLRYNDSWVSAFQEAHSEFYRVRYHPIVALGDYYNGELDELAVTDLASDIAARLAENGLPSINDLQFNVKFCSCDGWVAEFHVHTADATWQQVVDAVKNTHELADLSDLHLDYVDFAAMDE